MSLSSGHTFEMDLRKNVLEAKLDLVGPQGGKRARVAASADLRPKMAIGDVALPALCARNAGPRLKVVSPDRPKMCGRLIEAHEKERAWIARELHDDIVQRIALLGIKLDEWDREVTQSTPEVHEHIRLVRRDLSDIMEGIRVLSHRLHSSKLDYIGLAAAARSFCQELSERQNVKIDFTQTGIPQEMPKEISLCLFRVLQEALQNAVKHSGVKYFRVELRGTCDQIQLSVSDSGVGFNPVGGASREGLGLISMQERMHLVDGEFLVQSGPSRGTKIYACAPLTGGRASGEAVRHREVASPCSEVACDAADIHADSIDGEVIGIAALTADAELSLHGLPRRRSHNARR